MEIIKIKEWIQRKHKQFTLDRDDWWDIKAIRIKDKAEFRKDEPVCFLDNDNEFCHGTLKEFSIDDVHIYVIINGTKGTGIAMEINKLMSTSEFQRYVMSRDGFGDIFT